MNELEKFFTGCFFPYIEQNQMDAIFILGDVFDDRRSLNVKAYNQAKRIFDYLDQFEVQTFVIPGNHDLYYKNTLTPNSVEPFVDKLKNFHYCGEPTDVKIGSTKFLLIPWICQENEAEAMRFIAESDANVLCTHTDIVGSQSVPGIFLDHGFQPEQFTQYDYVLNGHIHTRSSFNNIRNLGTQYQFNWSDYGQQKGFHVFDTEERRLEFVPNPSVLYDKFYYTEDLVEGIDPLRWVDANEDRITDKFIKFVVTAKTDHYTFEKFLARVQQVRAHEINFIENITDSLTGEDVNPQATLDQSKSTMHIINDYLEVYPTTLNKSLMSQLLAQLYTEALNKRSELS